MFNFGRRETKTQNKLYAVEVSIGPGDGSAMPPELLGASVVCYIPATDHLEALRNVARKLVEDKFTINEISTTVRELNPNHWAKHVSKMWPELVDTLPTQAEVLQFVDSGTIFYGPFCGYDSQ